MSCFEGEEFLVTYNYFGAQTHVFGDVLSDKVYHDHTVRKVRQRLLIQLKFVLKISHGGFHLIENFALT